MTEAESLPDAAPVVRQLPGGVLRKAREARGLTVGEVSGALKFSTRQIDALERDDFEQLQGKTFLRGFIRAYARMLKLEVEPLLSMLEAEPLPLQEQIVAPGNMGDTEPAPVYRRYGKWIFAVVLAAVIVVGAAWYLADQQPRPAGVPPIAAAIPVEHETVSVVSPVAVDIPLALSDTAAQSAVQPAVQPPPAPVLTFEFSDASWLEVEDGSGRILLTGVFPGGQRQTVSGVPPYKLWIGKASAVKVTYKDQPFDFQPYVRDEVARFTLDK